VAAGANGAETLEDFLCRHEPGLNPQDLRLQAHVQGIRNTLWFARSSTIRQTVVFSVAPIRALLVIFEAGGLGGIRHRHFHQASLPWQSQESACSKEGAKSA